MFEIKELNAGYEFRNRFVHAVRNVSLTVEEGDFYGIAGESGCGKSTLVLAALKLLKKPGKILSGQVLLDGVDVLSLPDETLRKIRWKRLSLVTQSSMNSLNPVKRIKDQMADVLIRNHGFSKSDAYNLVKEKLQLVGITADRMESYPHQLSGGMRQRVVIAMALLLSPSVVVMDEPTTALDVVVQRSILQQIEELRKKENFSTIFITHDISLLFELASKISIMYAGELVEIGLARDVYTRPMHPYTKGLIEALPSISKDLDSYKSIPGRPVDLAIPIQGCPFKERCPYAFERCAVEKPQMRYIELDGNGRWVSCHLY
ncbi:MAG: ABC transporter ATP-binding protein [Fervidobacterium pennivorans]|uniref:Peptide ABC transporter ATPase n=3 Tax=Fervidobacterium TaxID=2422 RepID=A0A172T4M4_FERPE|nr:MULTISPECIES: ABC transporter ATP-binding protein [Fervidobacterium]MDM7321400.1 ABC transporter ATP-binding protein [Fervidobacterium sp.]AMW32714.1 ABC transporter ATP-binding protein [Fervidobacterium islandicum]ANE41896.1 peptide ABC transporter ATPase [Fervidobacterium pennivorans]QAV32750.1 ABC transporter ATP-binding protein [Fervidobacterium changbaicum]SDG97040.1 peptide/nickel transport system ATP-binding protein [Fervidobacterium changbaicum]